MNDGPIVRRISFDIHGEFITQLAREWFYTGEKSHEKVIEILMDSMTGTDTPEAQIRRYAEDILLGRAALKGSTAAGTYHLETYEPGEEEQMPQSMNIWKEVERRKKAEKDLRRMIERWDVAMDHISESTQREIRKELGEETAEDRQQDALDSFMARMMDKEDHTTEDYGMRVFWNTGDRSGNLRGDERTARNGRRLGRNRCDRHRQQRICSSGCD